MPEDEIEQDSGKVKELLDKHGMGDAKEKLEQVESILEEPPYDSTKDQIRVMIFKGDEPLLSLQRVSDNNLDFDLYHANKYHNTEVFVEMPLAEFKNKILSDIHELPFEQRWKYLENMADNHADPWIRQWLHTILPIIKSIYPEEQ